MEHASFSFTPFPYGNLNPWVKENLTVKLSVWQKGEDFSCLIPFSFIVELRGRQDFSSSGSHLLEIHNKCLFLLGSPLLQSIISLYPVCPMY